MAKTLTEAEKERARANQEYWEKREKAQAAAYQLEENNLEQHILNRYDYLLTEIEARINDFYQRFARAEGITMNLAEMAVSQMDVKAYNTRAAQLVKDRDFSPKANQELRLYNATMRINRLEMLKSRIGLEMLDTYQQLEDEFGEAFRNRCTEEYERQAGILGQSTNVMPQKDIERILTADFNNANWSSRLWANQGALRDRLSELLTNGIIQGRSVRALARDLQELLIAPSANNALRLMRTEMNRVQTETQMASYRDNGYKQYMFISTEDSRTCSQCAHLNGEIFDVDDPEALKPPQHPNCRCSTAAWMDREAYEEWLDSGAAAEGVSWEEWQALTNKETESWQKSTESFASGPIMSSLNNPAITNSDEVVQNFVDAVEVSDELKNSECFLNSVRHMPKDDLDMIARHGLIVKTTNGTNAFNARKARGADGKLKYVIKINPKSTEPYVFAHECAHMAEKINHLYKDPEFVEVLNNFGKSVTGIFPGEVNGEWYCTAVSDLLIEPYQGRTYVRHMGRYGPERNIVLTDFVEYISDGYECFIGDPELLASKDLMLYNYFKRRGLR